MTHHNCLEMGLHLQQLMPGLNLIRFIFEKFGEVEAPYAAYSRQNAGGIVQWRSTGICNRRFNIRGLQIRRSVSPGLQIRTNRKIFIVSLCFGCEEHSANSLSIFVHFHLKTDRYRQF